MSDRSTRHLYILHIITGLGRGGAESMLQKLVTYRGDEPRAKHEVVSLTDIGPVGRNMQELGIPVTAVGFRGVLTAPWAFLRLFRILCDRRPDIVQTWMYHANLLGGLAAVIVRRAPVVWNIRASALDPSERRLTKLIVAASGRVARLLCRRIVCNSHSAVADHIARGYPADMFVVIPNGFDLRVLRPHRSAGVNLRRELAIPADAPLVGMLARFHPMKDHSTFVKAAALLRDRLANAHFLLAGEGVNDENSELVRQLTSLGLAACTRLVGVRTDVARVMSSLDLFTLTSSSGEGFPNVLGEAMACEVPCVSTRVGDSAYVLGETGRIVPPRDPKVLADAWAALLQSSAQEVRAMGSAGRARVEEFFSIGAVARQYIALYEEQSVGSQPNDIAMRRP